MQQPSTTTLLKLNSARPEQSRVDQRKKEKNLKNPSTPFSNTVHALRRRRLISIPPLHHSSWMWELHRDSLWNSTLVCSNLRDEGPGVLGSQTRATARDGDLRAVHVHLAVANFVEPRPARDVNARDI